jgi:hypothetical protein
MLLVQQMGGNLVEEMMNEEGFWDKFLGGRKWKKEEWAECVKDTPDWGQSWKEPEYWLLGEKQWFEEEDSGQEKIRRQHEHNMKLWKEKGEDYRLKWREEIEAEKERKRLKNLRKLREKQEEEERWTAYCAGKSYIELREKRHCEDQLRELWQKESMSGSEWHLLAHPDEVSATLTGGLQTSSEVLTLSERACGDDPSTDEEIKENGSEGHLPIYPDEVAAILTGGYRTSFEVFTLSERIGEDDPYVSGSSSSESSSEFSSESSSESSSSESCSSASSYGEEETESGEEEDLPPLIRLEDLVFEETRFEGPSSTTWEEIEARRPKPPLP